MLHLKKLKKKTVQKHWSRLTNRIASLSERRVVITGLFEKRSSSSILASTSIIYIKHGTGFRLKAFEIFLKINGIPSCQWFLKEPAIQQQSVRQARRHDSGV
ncbi:hypothetical protein T09_9740 [Trichinella sp. T9]|nr:hypothetical protein T09_9740 [Trichinella sp. T9]